MAMEFDVASLIDGLSEDEVNAVEEKIKSYRARQCMDADAGRIDLWNSVVAAIPAKINGFRTYTTNIGSAFEAYTIIEFSKNRDVFVSLELPSGNKFFLSISGSDFSGVAFSNAATAAQAYEMVVSALTNALGMSDVGSSVGNE